VKSRSTACRSSKDRQVFVFEIGHKHVARRVGDHKGELGRGGGQSRGHAAGPEHRDLVLPDGDRVSELGTIQVLNSYFLGSPEMNRRAVSQMEPGRHLGRPNGLLRGQRSHAHDRGEENGPAGTQGRLVMYMETFFPSSMFLTGRPAASMALSKEKLHPGESSPSPHEKSPAPLRPLSAVCLSRRSCISANQCEDLHPSQSRAPPGLVPERRESGRASDFAHKTAGNERPAPWAGSPGLPEQIQAQVPWSAWSTSFAE